MNRHFRRSLAAAAGAVAACALAGPASAAIPAKIGQPVDERVLAPLSSNTHPDAVPQNDRGRVSDSLQMKDMILLLRRSDAQEAALRKLMREQLDAKSAHYHKWLTAKEFGRRFGPARADVDALAAWLTGHGFNVHPMGAGGRAIFFDGNAGQVRAAFHTEIHNIEANGERHIANMSDPEMPAALAPAVVGIVKLNDYMPHPNFIKRDFTYKTDTKTYHAIVPEDLATIYNINPVFDGGNTGQGRTVVVIEDSNVATTNDWATFRSKFGLSKYSATFTQVHPTGGGSCSDPGIGGAEGEANLDAQWASAAAPSANIVLASCRDTTQFGGFLALDNLIDGASVPPVVSISYGTGEEGDGETENKYISSLYQQASAEGVSVFVSSGDEGSAENDHRGANPSHGVSISGWMSTAYNVSVGGTDFADTFLGTTKKYWNKKNTKNYGSAKSYMPEFPWSDSCANGPLSTSKGFATPYGSDGYCNNGGPHSSVAGSGGPSNCALGHGTGGFINGTCAGWPKPDWQKVFGVPNDGVRDTPDVSLMAANGLWGHYFVFCDTHEGSCGDNPADWPGAGGTSFSSPIWAGFMALIVNKSGGAQGLPNPVLYSIANEEYGRKGSKACNSSSKKASKPNTSCIFYDVTLGDNDVNCVAATSGPVDCYIPSGTTGVLSTSNDQYQPAFATKKGWDFATGIGTVNVANLVNAWPQ
ncbi:MAG TPA: S53 family peptidase [Rhizomicrobium sp.]|nr:S53 family peptidase [Rhizomicrobium sp.]